jgi:hypothetical protein
VGDEYLMASTNLIFSYVMLIYLIMAGTLIGLLGASVITTESESVQAFIDSRIAEVEGGFFGFFEVSFWYVASVIIGLFGENALTTFIAGLGILDPQLNFLLFGLPFLLFLSSLIISVIPTVGS